jgi:hypothetical protein
MARTPFWRSVLRAWGAVIVHDARLRGASGENHEFCAVGVHPASGWTVAVLEDTDARLAALVHHDVSAASTTPVLLVRPVGVDFPALAERMRDLGLLDHLWDGVAAGGRSPNRLDAEALQAAWREHIGRNATRYPITPLERLAEVLRRVGRLRARLRGGRLEMVFSGEEADARVREGVWDFPLYRLSDEQIERIVGADDNDEPLRILARAGIHSPVPDGRDASPGLLLNRHRAVSPA